ncbi:DMT family transporter [Bacteroidia bacterium]|nr:DMT family transporter [Bacteroidia bacterium]
MKSRYLPLVLIAVLGMVWGSSFILMKRGALVFSPIQVAGIRLFLASLVLLPWVIKYSLFQPYRSSEAKEKILRKKDYLWLFISGLIGNGLPAFFFAYSVQVIPSALSGILNAFTPLFTLVFGYLLYKDNIDRNSSIGVLIGLFGAVFLFGPSLLSYSAPIPILGALLPLAGAALYGLNINIIKQHLNHLPGMVKTAYPFVSTGFIYCFILWQTDVLSLWETYPGELFAEGPMNANTAFFYLFLLGILGSALSMLAFNYVIKFVKPIMASTTTFIIPLTAVMWGLFDQESINWNTFVGLAFLLTAVYLIIKPAKTADR